MNDFMTIKEFCEITGLNRMTIQRAIKKLYPKKMSRGRGKLTTINDKESKELMKELRIKDLPKMNKNVQVEQFNQNISMNDVLSSIKMLADTVNLSMQGFDNRLKNLEGKYHERKALLPAPEKTDRMNLNEIIRSYAKKKDMYHSVVWNILYKEASYRLSINLKLQAERNNKAIIDYIDESGYLPEIVSIAMDILANKD